MNRERSVRVATADGSAGAKKLGQPVPESNFASERKSSVSQPAHRYAPGRCSSQRLPVKARSVPFWRRTRYCSGVRAARHSAAAPSCAGEAARGGGTFGGWQDPRRRAYGLPVDDPTSATSQPVDGVEMAVARRPPTRRRSLLLVLGLAALIGLGAIGVARATAESCSPFARGECVRVLFLGNSYTYVNDLPAVFRHLARAGGRMVETGMIANGGETLAKQAASQECRAAIRATGRG